MNAVLFWKDFRLFRVPFVASFVLAVVVYSGATVQAFDVWSRSDRSRVYAEPYDPMKPERLVWTKDVLAGVLAYDVAIPAALVGMGLVAILSVAFGGMAFASERHNRSADFLAMLPITRRQIVVSKLKAVLLGIGAPVLLHLAVIAVYIAGAGDSRWIIWPRVGMFAASIAHSAAILVLFFGIAWMLSAMLDRASLAASVSIAAAIVVLQAITNAVWVADASSGREPNWTTSGYILAPVDPRVHARIPTWVEFWTFGTAFGIGAVCLLIGTVIYLRRVSP